MRHRIQGFSLIELLIVIVIMGSLATVGISNYRDFARRQEIDNFTRTLEGDVRRAQSDSANGRVLAGCNGPFLGYRMRFFVPSSNNATSYALIAICGTSTIVAKTVTLPTSLVIALNRNPSGGVVDLLFRPLQGGTDVPSGNNLTLTVTSSSLAITTTKTITITSTGEIQ